MIKFLPLVLLLTSSLCAQVLTVPNGGTGKSTLAAHGALVGNGAGPIMSLSPGVAGYCYMSNGPGSDPSFQPCIGSSVPLNNLTAATAVNILTNGNNSQAWNWSMTGTNQTVGMQFGEGSPSTNTGYQSTVVWIETLPGSTVSPLQVNAQFNRTANGGLGAGNGFLVSTLGDITALGTSNFIGPLRLPGILNATGLATDASGNVIAATGGGGPINGTTGTFTGTVTAPTFVGNLTGNATSATALAATPTQCTGGQFSTGIAATGNANCGNVPSGFTAGGDLSGTSSSQTVTGIQTKAVPAPASGYLHYNGSSFVWDTPAGSGGGITSINGNTAAAQSIVGTAPITVSSASGTTTVACPTCGAGSTGTVTTFSSNNLVPLFTTSVATPTTTPALTHTLTTQVANTVFGNFTGSTAGPTFSTIAACGDATHALSYTAGTGFTCQTLSSGGGGALSALLPATATNTISNASWVQTWNWVLTGANNGFVIGEASAGSGTGSLFRVNSLSNLVIPLDVLGATSQIHFNNAGQTPSTSGGWLAGNPGGVHLLFNSHYNGSAWMADGTSATKIELDPGGIGFFGNTGLTPGNTFTPRQVENIIPNVGGGNYNIHQLYANGNASADLHWSVAYDLGIAAGMTYDGTNWTARAPNAELVNLADGAFSFLGATGLTVGNTVTLPVIATINTSGTFTSAAASFTGNVTSGGLTVNGPSQLLGTVGMTRLNLTSGVNSGQGFQVKRTSSCTTPSAGGQCTTTVTWALAFVDSNYTVSCTFEQTVGGGSAGMVNVTNKTATTLVATIGDWVAGSNGGIINCMAFHD